MAHKHLKSIIIALLFVSLIQVFCNDSDPDDSSDHPKQVDGDDDDSTDDDNEDDDDDTTFTSPVISDSFWAPDPVELDIETDYFSSTIYFHICDPNNDLSGGYVHGFISGTSTNVWADGPVPFESFGSIPDVSDCEVPVQFGIPTRFYINEAPPWGNTDFCIDLYAVDAAGNQSNVISDICVNVP